MKSLQSLYQFLKETWPVLVVVTALFYYFVDFQMELFQTAMVILVLEMVALCLSFLAVYIYTGIAFIKRLTAGPDEIYSANERLGNNIIVASVFLGVHLLVGISAYGMYFAQFSNS